MLGALQRLKEMSERDENRKHWLKMIEGNELLDLIETVNDICHGIGSGKVKQPFLFIGPPGCGKSTAFKAAMRASNRAFREIKSASPEGLAEALSECAATNTVAFLDDANDVLRSRPCCQLLMTATLPQNKGENRIWDKPLANGRKRQFDFDGLQTVIMTNLSHEKLLAAGGMEVQALIDTRLRVVERPANRATEFFFTAYMAVVREALKPLGLSCAQVNMALEHFTLNRDRIPSLSLRTLEELLVLIDAAPNTWRRSFRLDDVRRESFETIIPQIVAAPKRPRANKAFPPQFEKAAKRPKSFFCSLDDEPTNEGARAAQERARKMVLELAAQGWSAPMICEQVEFETYVEVREKHVQQIMGAMV